MKSRMLQAGGVSAVLLALTVAQPWAQSSPSTSLGSGQERIDFDAIYRIEDEGFERSQVMETLSYLTDIHGPRLTNSPNFVKAAWSTARTRATPTWISTSGFSPRT